MKNGGIRGGTAPKPFGVGKQKSDFKGFKSLVAFTLGEERPEALTLSVLASMSAGDSVLLRTGESSGLTLVL